MTASHLREGGEAPGPHDGPRTASGRGRDVLDLGLGLARVNGDLAAVVSTPITCGRPPRRRRPEAARRSLARRLRPSLRERTRDAGPQGHPKGQVPAPSDGCIAAPEADGGLVIHETPFQRADRTGTACLIGRSPASAACPSPCVGSVRASLGGLRQVRHPLTVGRPEGHPRPRPDEPQHSQPAAQPGAGATRDSERTAVGHPHDGRGPRGAVRLDRTHPWRADGVRGEPHADRRALHEREDFISPVASRMYVQWPELAAPAGRQRFAGNLFAKR